MKEEGTLSGAFLEPPGWTWGGISGHRGLPRICLPTVHAPPLKEGHCNDESAWSWVIRHGLELTCQSEQGRNGVDHRGFIFLWRTILHKWLKQYFLPALHAFLETCLAPHAKVESLSPPLELELVFYGSCMAEVKLCGFRGWGRRGSPASAWFSLGIRSLEPRHRAVRRPRRHGEAMWEMCS